MFSNDKGSGFQGQGTSISGVPLQQSVNQDNANGAQQLANQGVSDYQGFVNALNAQQGLQNQQSTYNQLQNIANGTGPNPAQAMLNNSTGQNVAQQGALMAGQRGASANTGLMARQIANQGAQIQQNAIGQGAAMQANQSLNAINSMGGIAGQQVNQQMQGNQGFNQAAQGLQNNYFNANNNYNNANVGMQSNINNANVGMQSNINNVNAGIAQGNQTAQQNMVSGITNGAGKALMMADGGEVIPGDPTGGAMGPKSRLGQSMNSSDSSGGGMGGGSMQGLQSLMGSGAEGAAAMPIPLAKGGSINGERVREVPGKASVKGDSLKNDKVKALLSPGEIVIPRSIAQAPDAARKAALFVAAVKSRKKI